MKNYKGEYLKELKLTNFRQFEELTLPIHPRLTVILGENGGGKTSICDALNLNLTTSVLENRQLDKINAVKRDNVKNGATDFKIELNLSKGSHRSINKSGLEEKESLRYGFSSKAPHFLYKNKKLFDRFQNWFINIKNYENQTRLEMDIDYREPILQVINNWWLKFFNALGTSKYENINIKTSPKKIHSGEKTSPAYQFIQIKKDGIWFEIEQLSAGEKQLLELFLNICLEVIESQTYFHKELTVVIDEIDLHLHPRWQRNLLPALMETFPEVQFIVTTHSPLIVSNVKAEHIVVLKDYKAYPLKTQTEGRDVNSVLLEVFDIPERPKWAAELIDECDKLIAAEQWAEAQKHIDLLSQRFGSTDAEVMRLQLAYDFNAPHNALKG